MNQTTLPLSAYCGVSTGTLDRTQDDPELLAANIARRERIDPKRFHPDHCGPCDECRLWIYENGNERLQELQRRELATVEPQQLRASVPGSPTLDQFITHARKFAPECVPETARAYLATAELAVLELEIIGVKTPNGKSARTRQRRTTDDPSSRSASSRTEGSSPPRSPTN
jgi:hypothetical protein